jgi:hypothetical protein
MPICTECHTRYIVQTYMDPAEPCECGACKKPRPEDYEPSEDELEARAMIAAMIAIDLGGRKP